MRIHQLSIQAFGPFAGTEHIDFDALGNAGLFLLDGPTGAGKSSILDAICYAIYGSLPGNRQGSRQIRSDHAAESLAPEVRCELSIGNRRFEVTRSPAWMRPNLRSKGRFTEQKAASSLRELVEGHWQGLSTRNDEVGQLLGGVLGLDREQFTKVVMLPQGGFADFLRAKDTEREKLLSRLFDTSDYARIEEEFSSRLATERKHTEQLELELATGETQVRADATDHLEGAGIQLPGTDEPAAGFEQLENALVKLVATHHEAATASRRELEAIRAKHATLAEHRRVFTRLAELQSLQAEHAAQSELAQEAEAQLQLDAKARQVRAYEQQRTEALKLQHTSSERLDEAKLRLEKLDSEAVWQWDHDGLSELLRQGQEASQDIGVLRSVLPEEEQRAVLSQDLATQQQLVIGQRKAHEAAEAATAELVTERRRLESAQLDEVAAATAVTTCQSVRDAAVEKVTAATQRETLAAAVSKAEAKYAARALKLNALEREQLDLQRSHLEQSAVRLAAQLAAGEPCLVCGSTTHPQPAFAEPGAELISDEQLEAIDTKVAEQRSVERREERKLQVQVTKHEAAQEAAGQVSVVEATALVEQAEERLQDAKAHLVATRQQLARLAELGRSIEQQSKRAAAAKLAQSVAEEKTATGTAQLAALGAKIEKLRQGHESLQHRLDALTSRHGALEQAGQALQKSFEAQHRAQQADTRWHAERTAAGFSDEQAYMQGLLDTAQRTGCEAVRDAQQRRANTIEALVASPDVRAATELTQQGLSAPDAELLQGLAQELQAADDAFEAVRQREVLSTTALDRLRAGVARLEELAKAAGPVIDSFRRLKALAEVVRGAGENRLKMTLSTYVLAARLEEVTAAATERLQVMSSQRYSLHHDDTARGNAKSGLGIRVHDAWTGKHRETQTLSGGETFMASLALALGLADVISHHSGAVDMQTLFVDEGFGSLDAETLEQVMEALESLRSGGRVIGVVSHVSEMKQRIANRLTVLKTRQGSTIQASAENLLAASS